MVLFLEEELEVVEVAQLKEVEEGVGLGVELVHQELQKNSNQTSHAHT